MLLNMRRNDADEYQLLLSIYNVTKKVMSDGANAHRLRPKRTNSLGDVVTAKNYS